MRFLVGLLINEGKHGGEAGAEAETHPAAVAQVVHTVHFFAEVILFEVLRMGGVVGNGHGSIQGLVKIVVSVTSAGKRKSLRSVSIPVPSTNAESATKTLRNDLRAHALV